MQIELLIYYPNVDLFSKCCVLLRLLGRNLRLAALLDLTTTWWELLQ